MEFVTFKSLILISCLLSVVMSASSKSSPTVAPLTEKAISVRDLDFEAIMDNCNTTYPVEVEFMATLNETGSFPDETQTVPKVIKSVISYSPTTRAIEPPAVLIFCCFVRCYYENIGMMNTDGNFNIDTMKDYFTMNRSSSLETEIIEKIVQACGEDRLDICPCDKAYYTNRCVMENIINSLNKTSEN